VARFYARRQAWGAVRGRAETLVRRYPDTPQVPEALSVLGTSLHAWGDVDLAVQVRERLAEEAPESRWLARLDRHMARPPGEKPDEKVFIRPYRIRGGGPGTPGGAPGTP
jgi:outer membrane protein assembly factor BamD (BamD/ComL family)